MTYIRQALVVFAGTKKGNVVVHSILGPILLQ